MGNYCTRLICIQHYFSAAAGFVDRNDSHGNVWDSDDKPKEDDVGQIEKHAPRRHFRIMLKRREEVRVPGREDQFADGKVKSVARAEDINLELHDFFDLSVSLFVGGHLSTIREGIKSRTLRSGS